MSAAKIRNWLICNDLPFAYSLRNLDPKDAGIRICERYEIDTKPLESLPETEAVAHVWKELEKRNG